MTDIDLERLLGSAHDDPGCNEAGELMDAYCELVSRGETVTAEYDGFLAHMSNCAACREDMEGLLAALRNHGDEGSR